MNLNEYAAYIADTSEVRKKTWSEEELKIDESDRVFKSRTHVILLDDNTPNTAQPPAL